MSKLTTILYTLAILWAVSYVSGVIFSFFGVGFETYGVYLFFIIAMGLFNSFLPGETGKMFHA